MVIIKVGKNIAEYFERVDLLYIFRGFKNKSNAILDLFVGVYRATSGTAEPRPISYVAHSDRRIKPSVLCNVFLDAGVYLIGNFFCFYCQIYMFRNYYGQMATEVELDIQI